MGGWRFVRLDGTIFLDSGARAEETSYASFRRELIETLTSATFVDGYSLNPSVDFQIISQLAVSISHLWQPWRWRHTGQVNSMTSSARPPGVPLAISLQMVSTGLPAM